MSQGNISFPTEMWQNHIQWELTDQLRVMEVKKKKKVPTRLSIEKTPAFVLNPQDTLAYR